MDWSNIMTECELVQIWRYTRNWSVISMKLQWGGHLGILATYYRIKKLFYWPGLKSGVEEFTRQCQTCQQAKHEHTCPAGTLQPLPVPEGAWQDLTMDLTMEFRNLWYDLSNCGLVNQIFTYPANSTPFYSSSSSQGVPRQCGKVTWRATFNCVWSRQSVY